MTNDTARTALASRWGPSGRVSSIGTAKRRLLDQVRAEQAIAALNLSLDALDRDFTINAIYYDFENDSVVDPTGQGLDDLLSRTVRFIGGTADEQFAARPDKLGPWLEMMSKHGADGTYFDASLEDKQAALKWLDEHSRLASQKNINRFIDRITATPTEVEATVRRVFEGLDVESAVEALDRIYGRI